MTVRLTVALHQVGGMLQPGDLYDGPSAERLVQLGQAEPLSPAADDLVQQIDRVAELPPPPALPVITLAGGFLGLARIVPGEPPPFFGPVELEQVMIYATRAEMERAIREGAARLVGQSSLAASPAAEPPPPPSQGVPAPTDAAPEPQSSEAAPADTAQPNGGQQPTTKEEPSSTKRKGK